MSALVIDRLPAFQDNYLWMIRSSQSATKAFAVDPGDAAVIERFLDENGCELAGILVTHHHADHIGGVAELKAKHACRVVGPAFEPRLAKLLTEFVDEADTVEIDGSLATVLQVHGHTSSHVAYHLASQGEDGMGALFCGDSLFSLGCGRMFEGSAQEMWASLEKMRALPDNTLVYCAHEYTASNAKFALHVDPDNSALRSFASEIFEKRARYEATVPCLLAHEKKLNPFLRADVLGPTLYPEVNAHAMPINAQYFANLRKAKDNWSA